MSEPTLTPAQVLAQRARARLEEALHPKPPPPPEPEPQAQQAEEPATVVEVTVADIETDEPVYSSLTAREQVFVDAVVMGSSYTDAARLAGYGPDRPDISGSKLMRKPAVRMAVQERRTQAAHAAGIDTHRILVRMADIAFGRSVVDSDVVMMRALETLLTYTTKGGGSVEERTTLARSITDRFNRAKLRPAKPVLKLITGSQK